MTIGHRNETKKILAEHQSRDGEIPGKESVRKMTVRLRDYIKSTIRSNEIYLNKLKKMSEVRPEDVEDANEVIKIANNAMLELFKTLEGKMEKKDVIEIEEIVEEKKRRVNDVIKEIREKRANNIKANKINQSREKNVESLIKTNKDQSEQINSEETIKKEQEETAGLDQENVQVTSDALKESELKFKRPAGDDWIKGWNEIDNIRKEIDEISKDFSNMENREELIGRKVYLQRIHPKRGRKGFTNAGLEYIKIGEKYYEANMPKSGQFVLPDEWKKLLVDKTRYENDNGADKKDDEIEIIHDGEGEVDEIKITNESEPGEPDSDEMDDEWARALSGEQDDDESSESSGSFGDLVISDRKIADALKAEIGKISAAEKKTLFEGLADIGFKVSETKSRIIKDFLIKISKKTGDGTMNKFFDQYASIYGKQEESAKRSQEAISKGKLQKLSGIGQGFGGTAGFLLRLGRAGFDIVNQSTANPLRYVTMAGMMAGRSMEAAKKVRFLNEEVLEKTRVGDDTAYNNTWRDMDAKDRTWDETYYKAWEIHEQARNDFDIAHATKKDLEKVYREKLPEDLKNRLDRIKDVGTSFLQRKLNKDIDYYVNDFDKKINKIKENNKLSEADKEKKIEELLLRNTEFLNDLDRMVGDAGIVDNIAYFSMAAEKTGKTVANLMMVDSVGRLASAGFNMFNFEKDYGLQDNKAISFITKYAEKLGVIKPVDMPQDVASDAISEVAESVPQPAVNNPAESLFNDSVQPNYDPFARPEFIKPFSQSVSDKSVFESPSQLIVEPESGQNIEVKIGGEINTFSEAVNEAVKGASPEVKDNFIHQVLGDKVEISEESRQDLLRKAIAKLSIDEVQNGQDVPNLVYDGNQVILHQDGSWEVQKGDGVFKARVAAPVEVEHSENLETKPIAPDVVKDNIHNKVIGENAENTVNIDEAISNVYEKEVVMTEFIKAGINKFIMEDIGVDSENPGLPGNHNDIRKLNFLLECANNEKDFSKAVDALKLTANTNISPEDAFKYYDKISSFKGHAKYKMEAAVELMKDVNLKDEHIRISINHLLEGRYPKKEELLITNGVLTIKNYFADGFDFVMTNTDGEVKIGIDGPGGSNWGVKGGWFSALRPTKLLTAENIGDAKEAVKKMFEQLKKEE